jgi:hypothetical protein
VSFKAPCNSMKIPGNAGALTAIIKERLKRA